MAAALAGCAAYRVPGLSRQPARWFRGNLYALSASDRATVQGLTHRIERLERRARPNDA